MKSMLHGILVVLLSFGVALAQNNTATTTQNGDGNSAEVTQAGTQNQAVVNQTQSFNDGHIAVINQTTTDGSDGNLADVLQGQSSAEAYISQTGNANVSTSKQSGYNVLNVTQEGNDNVLGGYFNYADRAFQKNGGGSFASDMNVLSLTQTGSANMAGLWQEHHAEATIDQAGADNVARIYQSGAAFGDMNVATVAEYGDANTAELHQVGDGNKATAKLGHPNYVSNLNMATIEQEGYGNDASFSLLKGSNNVVSIDQTYGDNNYSEYSVKYGDNNQITAVDEGNYNRTRLNVTADWGSNSSGNAITVTKTGDYNYVAGAVAGSDNTINLLQNGNNNRVGTSWYTGDGINVQGNANLINISQMSDGNMSLNTVTGSGNTINVSQN